MWPQRVCTAKECGHTRVCTALCGHILYILCVQNVCTITSVYHKECVPQSVCTTKSVYHNECVPQRVCTTKSVYSKVCVPQRVCTAKSVYHKECVPQSVTRDHSCEFCQSRYYVVGTGWRTPTGCLKLLVIFCKRATNYRALLREMTDNDKASYGSWPPCTHCFD